MLHIRNLYFNYPNQVSVLKSIDLNLDTGNIYGLFGKNGEGKTTLIKVITGLLYPKSGECRFDNIPTSQRKPSVLQEVFLVPEDFELPAVSVNTFATMNSKFYPNFSQEHFDSLLKEFNINPLKKIPTLSFGQKKKVLIAFGIAVNTSLLLMDEPTNGLDIPSKSQFRKVMAASVDKGQCIVISTHQVRDLHSLINHVIILDDARVVLNQSLQRISEVLWFGRASGQDKNEIVYSEGAFGGKTIVKRGEKDESEMDLELLFNGVLQERQTINQLLEHA